MRETELSPKKLLIVAAVLMLLVGISVFSAPRTAYASSSSTGLIVPLYSYPGSVWQELIQEKQAHPSVPVIAVINPDNGPGSYLDPTILNGVRSMQAAGITVIGYVYTTYGTRSLSTVESDINSYKSMYGVSGIFLDEMINVVGHESYYSTLTNYIHSHGMPLSVGNPGAGVPPSYIGTVDVIVIFEDGVLPNISFIASLTNGFGKQNFAMIAYDVSSVSSSYVSSVSNYVSYMYITDGQYPNQYDSLPSYISSLMSDLASVNAAGSGNVALTIESVALNGSSISGLWTVISSKSGTTLKTGFTPLIYQATIGGQYIVSVSNYKNYVFSHWSNGDTSNAITVSPTQATTLTAYYSTGPTQAALTIDSVSLSGAPIKGLWTVIQSSDGSVVANGYTPLSYKATLGSSYTVSVSNYGTYAFSHWAGGSTDSSITVTPNAALTLTAYYSTGPIQVPLTINSVDLGGSPISGLWTVIQSSDGTVLASGYTPLSYQATAGATYTVSVSNYGSYIFSHWADGSTSNAITITPNSATNLTAYYNAPATITLESVGPNGVQFNGMWITVSSPSGATLSDGYTTLTFDAVSGSQYVIEASNYGSYAFSHWSNGSTSRTITVTASGFLTLVAYYN